MEQPKKHIMHQLKWIKHQEQDKTEKKQEVKQRNWEKSVWWRCERKQKAENGI